MNETDGTNDDKSLNEASIKERIAAREAEIWFGSRVLAGLIGAVILFIFAYFREPQFLGAHPLLISAAVGFVMGVLLGERIVFTGVGVLLTYFFLPVPCG